MKKNFSQMLKKILFGIEEETEGKPYKTKEWPSQEEPVALTEDKTPAADLPIEGEKEITSPYQQPRPVEKKPQAEMSRTAKGLQNKGQKKHFLKEKTKGKHGREDKKHRGQKKALKVTKSKTVKDKKKQAKVMRLAGKKHAPEKKHGKKIHKMHKSARPKKPSEKRVGVFHADVFQTGTLKTDVISAGAIREEPRREEQWHETAEPMTRQETSHERFESEQEHYSPAHMERHEKVSELEKKARQMAKEHEVPEEDVSDAEEKILSKDVIRQPHKVRKLNELQNQVEEKKITPLTQAQKKEVHHEILGIIEEIQKHRILTDFDRIYELVNQKQRIQTNVIAQQLGIPKKRVQDCSQILEEDKLIEVDFPPVGDEFLQVPGFAEKMREEKKKKKTEKEKKNKEEKTKKQGAAKKVNETQTKKGEQKNA